MLASNARSATQERKEGSEYGCTGACGSGSVTDGSVLRYVLYLDIRSERGRSNVATMGNRQHRKLTGSIEGVKYFGSCAFPVLFLQPMFVKEKKRIILGSRRVCVRCFFLRTLPFSLPGFEL
jgi:hypothetical protein